MVRTSTYHPVPVKLIDMVRYGTFSLSVPYHRTIKFTRKFDVVRTSTYHNVPYQHLPSNLLENLMQYVPVRTSTYRTNN